VLHYGDHTVVAGVREFRGEEDFEAMEGDAVAAFEKADFPEAVRALDRHFGSSNYSLKNLFRDEQRKLLRRILDSTLRETATVYRQVYENHAPLMRFIGDLGVPLPSVLRTTAEFVLNGSLREEFQAESPDLEQVLTVIDTARREGVGLDQEGLSFELRRSLERLMGDFHEDPDSVGDLESLARLASLARSLPFEVDLARTQDLYWELLRDAYPARCRQAEDAASRAWCAAFESLGAELGVRVPPSPASTEAPAPTESAETTETS
jgi:hypothetical protein